MNREKFMSLLQGNEIDPNIVSFDSSVDDGYNIRKNRIRWETFVRERGREYNCIGFPSESDALEYMLEKLIELYGKKNDGLLK